MSPGEEIQRLILQTLKADAAVMALIDNVYDRVPESPFGAKEAYVSFGPSDMVPDDPDCIEGEEWTFQLDVWSRKVGQLHCRQICTAVKNALHLVEFDMANNALGELRLALLRIMADPDELTTHGAMQFAVSIEVPSA